MNDENAFATTTQCCFYSGCLPSASLSLSLSFSVSLSASLPLDRSLIHIVKRFFLSFFFLNHLSFSYSLGFFFLYMFYSSCPSRVFLFLLRSADGEFILKYVFIRSNKQTRILPQKSNMQTFSFVCDVALLFVLYFIFFFFSFIHSVFNTTFSLSLFVCVFYLINFRSLISNAVYLGRENELADWCTLAT